jgi:hypothetical protein
MERVPHRDRLVPSRRDARELQRHADRLGAPGREKHLVQVAGCRFDEAPRERDRVRVGEPARRERQRVERALDCLDDARMPVPDLMHAVAVEVQVAAAFHVGEPGARRASERVHARRRERLMQEVARVLVEQGARRRADVRRLPLPAARREVDVAFGGGIVRRRRKALAPAHATSRRRSAGLT